MSRTTVQPMTPARVAAGATMPAAASLARRADRRTADGLRAGDHAALEAVHAQCGGAGFGYLRHVLRDRAAAEDVHQQVFTEIWRRGAQYDERRGSLATWALTIARSRAIDELRRRRPEPVDPADLPEETAVHDDELLDRWVLAGLVAELPEEERGLLRLRFEQGLSQSEIATLTGVPIGTVKTRM